MTNNLATKLGNYCFLVVFGVMILLNLQPWLHVSNALLSGGLVIPLQAVMYSIPVLGIVIRFMVENLTDVVAIVLYFVIQYVQTLSLQYSMSNRIHRDIKDAESNTYKVSSKRSKRDKLKSAANKAHYYVLDNAEWLRWTGYLIEFVVCGYNYQFIKGNNFFRLFEGISTADPDTLNLIEWSELIPLLVTIFAFEGMWKLYLTIREVQSKQTHATD